MSQWHAKNHWSNNYPWFIFNIDSHKLEQCPIYISIYQSKDLNSQTCTVWVITLLQIDELFWIQKRIFFLWFFFRKNLKGMFDWLWISCIPVSLQNQNFILQITELNTYFYYKILECFIISQNSKCSIKWCITDHITKCFFHSFFLQNYKCTMNVHLPTEAVNCGGGGGL